MNGQQGAHAMIFCYEGQASRDYVDKIQGEAERQGITIAWEPSQGELEGKLNPFILRHLEARRPAIYARPLNMTTVPKTLAAMHPGLVWQMKYPHYQLNEDRTRKVVEDIQAIVAGRRPPNGTISLIVGHARTDDVEPTHNAGIIQRWRERMKKIVE